MGSFTWKNALPRLGFELADLNRCPLSLCAFMYVNGSTCWLWPHFPLCLESLTGRLDVTLSFSPPRGAWLLGLFAVGSWNYGCIKLFVFLLTPALDRGQERWPARVWWTGRWSLRQPLSPLGSGFRWCAASELSDGSKRLRLALCPHAPWTDWTLPISGSTHCCQEEKGCFWPFVSMWFACECVSGVHVISLACQWTKSPAECWELLSKAVQRNWERSFFLHVFEQSWPALHVPVGFLQSLAEAPAFSSAPTALPPFFFYTCFFKVAFSATALLLAYIEKNQNCPFERTKSFLWKAKMIMSNEWKNVFCHALTASLEPTCVC